MNPVQKLVVTALCATLALAAQPARPTAAAEPPATPTTQEQKPAAEKPAAVKQSPTDPVARVGTTVITRAELDRATAILLKQNQAQEPLTIEQKKQVQDYLIDQLASAEMLYQAGIKLEIKDLDKKVTEKIEQAKARYPSPEEFDKAIKEQNLDEKTIREYTKKEIVVNNLIEKEIAPKATVTDEEAKKFYTDNLDKYFTKPEQVKASHILIGVDAKATDEEKKKAREKAEGILKEVKAGKDFAELAKTSSTCPSKDQGGDLGYFGKGQMVKPFEDAAFALKQGETSGVVETQFGYHIIKLTEKKSAENTSFDEAKQKITEYLQNQKIQAKVAEYINELKSKIKVEKLIS
jgi:peptidyl-prolyl cis-trans isomerase C